MDLVTYCILAAKHEMREKDKKERLRRESEERMREVNNAFNPDKKTPFGTIGVIGEGKHTTARLVDLIARDIAPQVTVGGGT